MDRLHDFRVIARVLAKNRGFAAIAVACMALGVGATTTVFSLANGLFLRPLPGIADADRLVRVHGLGSYPDLRDLEASTTATAELAGVGGFLDQQVSLETGIADGPRAVVAQLVSGGLFPVLGTRPEFGRLLTPEDVAEARPVVVVGHRLWRERLGGDPAAVGRTVRVNGFPMTVVGVAPPGFVGTFVGFRFDLWLPLSTAPRLAPEIDLDERRTDRLEVVARLLPGSDAGEAGAALAAFGRRLDEIHPGAGEPEGVRVEELTGFDPGALAAALGLVALLFGVALLVQLTACLNVASLLLARAVTRGRELGIRVALGAGRRQVAGLVLVESLLLALLGGALGLGLAGWATGLLDRLRPPVPFELALDFSIDVRVAAFALVAAIASGLLAGLGPAVRAGRRAPAATLSGTSPAGARRPPLRAGLVVAQVMASMVLLVVAGLLLRTLALAAEADPGFEPDGVEIAPLLDLRLLGPSRPAPEVLFRDLEERAAALPAVAAAGVAGRVPLAFQSGSAEVSVEGREPPAGSDGFEVDLDVVSPGLFHSLGIPVLEGRGFTVADRAGAPAVAVVNLAFARRFWPDAGAVGRRIELEGRRLAVVGVVGDVQYRRLGEAPAPFLFLPLAQRPVQRASLFVRTAEGAPPAAPEVRELLRELAPALPVAEIVPLRRFLAISLVAQRVAGAVAGVLGGIGLGLAGLGLYGLTAFVVGQRVREIGIRMALGSTRRRVLRLVLGGALRLAAAGVVLGAGLALAAARAVESLLYGVAPADPVTFGAVAALLVATALLGGYVPARRASRIDPLEVLRSG